MSLIAKYKTKIRVDNSSNYQQRFIIAIAATLFFLISASYLSGEIPALDLSYSSWLAVVLIIVGLLPAIHYYLSGFKKPIPFLELVCLFYVISFGLPALSEVGLWLRPEGAIFIDALLLVTTGLLCIFLGYIIFHFRLDKIIRPIRFPVLERWSDLERMGWLGEGTYIFYIVILSVFGDFGGPITKEIAALLGSVGKIALFYLLFTKRLSKLGIIIFFWTVFPIEVVTTISGGLLAQFMQLMLLVALVYIYVKKRISVTIILITFVFFASLNPVKYEYRQTYWYGNSDASKLSAFTSFIELAINYWSGSFAQQHSDALDKVTKRTDHIGLLAYVMEKTPSTLPYMDGETLYPLVYSWIPRAVWPGKPQEIQGNIWSKRYGIIQQDDYITSWNLPWIVEFYINFGVWGVLIGMFLTGCFVAVIERLFNRARSEILPLCVGLTVALTAWYMESNVSLMIGNLATKIVVALIFIYLSIRKFRIRI